MNWFIIINWSVMILGGVWCYLLVYDAGKSFKDHEEKNKLWHRKFDKWAKICAPAMIIVGIFLIATEFISA